VWQVWFLFNIFFILFFFTFSFSLISHNMQTHHRRRSSKSILLPRLSTINGNIPSRRVNENTTDTTYLWGYCLLFATFTFFVGCLYAMFGSKCMPDTGIKVYKKIYKKKHHHTHNTRKLLDWIKYDNYYCLLIPITAIVWIYFILWNWMGMKFFRHN
jgi:hypothetical protein